MIVCDLPVPGGPCSTKLLPADAAATALSCEESASTGTAISVSDILLSISVSAIKSPVSASLVAPSIRQDTTLLLLSSSLRFLISFHITNWPKLNSPIKLCSIIFHVFLPIIACLTVLKTSGRSMPCSSSGRGSRPFISMPWSCRKYSIIVTFIWASSWRLLII